LFFEDAAQALGASLNNVRAGTIGDCSVYSFNSNKVISGINGGGVFLTDDESKAKLVKKIRRHGKDKDFEMLGFNSRMYVLNAEVIDLRLQNAEQNQARRQEIARQYNNAFTDLPVLFQAMPSGLNHNYHKYTLRFENKNTRKCVKDILHASTHYEKPLSSNSMYSTVEFRTDECKNSKIVSDTILSLPIHAWLTQEEINYIVKCVRNAFK
jgi:dTDP-4-amino-4,6-dideoxygalactose transaminase